MTEESDTRTDVRSPPAGSDHGQFRQQLYRVMSVPDLTSAGKRQQLLELGREYLGVENGHIVKIDQQTDRHEIITASGSSLVTAGTVSNLDETYCRRTIATDDVLTVHNAHEGGWADDPATERWDINCYIGRKLLVGNDLYGSVCFVNSEPRVEQFSAEEESFMDLLSVSIGRLLDRDRFREKLEREQEWFELFVAEVSDYGIFMLDPAGHIVTWNRGAQEIKGYTEDEIVGEHFSRLYMEADRERGLPEQLLDEARRTGRVEHEGRRVRRDGSTFWALVTITALYDDEGVLRGFGKVTRDLTERRNARRALEAEQEFVEQALDSLDDIFFVLTAHGEFERVNQQMVDVTGYSEAEILSMDPVDFFVPEDRDAVTEGIAAALETGEASAEATLLTKGNERRRYELRGRRLTEDDGSVAGVVGIGRDITERTLYEERLEVAQRVMRHNLRTDLNVIKGWVEILADPDSEATEATVERVLARIDHLVDLSEKTRRMTALDPLASGSGPTIDVTTRLPEVVAAFRREFPEAEIDLELPSAERLPVATDDRFSTAIRNAIQNAIEHNPSDEPWVGIEVAADEGRVGIHVHDDGVGIPEKERRVLENTEETQLEHASGLGLWLIHWCVTTAGGELTFDEREPRGTTVTLRFPIAADS